MKLLSSLDTQDRKLLFWCIVTVCAIASGAAFLIPKEDNDENRLPSTYLAGQHGALAAYEMLIRAHYPLERWERPLGELAATSGPQTVLILAQPFSREVDDIKAVRQIIERGGRVLSTGFWGGYLLPSGSSTPPREFNFAACRLQPEGLDPLASSGEIWMVPQATWQVGKPSDRVQYSCAGQPAVVDYDWGKGHVVWWASATPLENGSLTRAQNLNLLINSLGPREDHHFYWDESLHGDVRSDWNFAGGPALTLLRVGLIVLALLVLISFSRRSGPMRELPPPPRATPVEFLEALGALYNHAGASSTAVAAAWERFRRHALRLCGRRGQRLDARELAEVIRRRFPAADPALESDLLSCEEGASNNALASREALRLVQLLAHHLDKLEIAANPAARTSAAAAYSRVPSHSQERAS